MEYNWSLEKIKRQKQQTKSLLRKTEGLTNEEKLILKDAIKKLKEMENILSSTNLNITFPKRKKYMDNNSLLSQDEYLSYEEIPNYIIELIIKATTCFQDYTDTYQDIEFPKLNLSNQRLVELSYDFYSWLPSKNYVKDFKFYTDPNKHLLQFIRTINSTCKGQIDTFYYPTYRPYFLIEKESTINDFLTLNHEIIHGIMGKKDNTASQNGEHYFLMELEGYYFDFLSI